MSRTGALAVVLCAAAAAAATPGDGPEAVTTRLEWEPGLLGVPGFVKVPFGKAAPEGVVPPPPGTASLFASIPLGEGRPVAVAADPRPESPRLWVDRDGDGDLSREEPLALRKDGEWFERLLTLRVRVAEETEPVPVPIKVTFLRKDVVSCWWDTRIHRLGTVVLGGMLRRLALRDGSQTLRFDGTGKPRLLLDLDGDGRVDDDEKSPEWVEPGAPFRVLDEGWSFRVPSPGGRAVEFTRLPEAPPAPQRPWKPEAPPGRAAASRRQGKPLADLAKAYRALPKDPDYSDVTEILKNVGVQGTDEAFTFLRSVAETASTETVRGYAVWYMANAAFLEKHGDEIAAFARSPTAGVAGRAVRTLYEIGHPQAERICAELTASSSPAVAGEAALHLAYTGTDAAREKVLSLARSHPSAEVRDKAYEGSRTFPGGPPPELMAAAARSGDLARRARGLRDMASIGHPGLRAAAMEVAAFLAKPPSSVAETREDDDVRTVVDLLTAFPDAACAAAALELAIRGADAVRSHALDRLSAMRSRSAVEALLAALRSAEDAHREAAARVLGRIPETGIATELMQALKREKSDAVAAAIVDSLGDQGDPSVAAPLLRAARATGAVRGAAQRALAHLGFGLPEVRRYLLDLLRAGSADERVLALEAVAASGDASLLPRALPSLDHDSWSARLAAVDALRRLRAREGVPPLVARLAREEVFRLRVEIGHALFELTGANFYEDAALWQRWLAENGETFQVPARVPRLPEENQAGTVGTFFGIPVESERVVFVIDRSGSMDSSDEERKGGEADVPTRLETALRQTLGAVGRLGKDARVNVILFDDEVHPWQKKVVPLTPAARADLEKHLRQQKPGSSTNLYDALELALRDPEADTVMLLSDGSPNEGRFTTEDDILAAVRRLNLTRRVAVHCVSLGTDSDLLRRLASENSGRYVRK
jgi:HEAT repeat protein